VNGLDRTSYTFILQANPSGGCSGCVSITTALGPREVPQGEPSHRMAYLLAAEHAEKHRRSFS